ncbi:MAG: mismatch-specific DNA-glycosylase [Chloroflexi bacterium]|nr:mismatch-specific DNA-glycosylase [Chloroflexota bacterium]
MKTLPDYLRNGLDLVFVGINPGTRSAATGHHYAGPGNHFWPLLYESGLVSEALTFTEDARVLEWNIGLTNMVSRPSPSITDLTLTELRDGAATLRRKLERYRPRIVCFNGKRIYEVFSGHACDFGAQPEPIDGSMVYVMPSTSARTAAYQRADKLRYFQELARLLASERKAAS